MKLIAVIYMLFMAGCHNGFCHNEFILFASFFGVIPLIGLRFKTWVNNTHKKMHGDVRICEKACEEHKK